MHLLPIFIIGGIGVICCVIIDIGLAKITVKEGELFWGVAPMVGYFSATISLGIALFSASLAGITYTLQHKRNLLPAAFQIASYLGGYLMAWACFSFICIAIIFALDKAGIMREWGNALQMPDEFLGFLSWFLPNLAFGVVYLRFVWRGTAGALYANR